MIGAAGPGVVSVALPVYSYPLYPLWILETLSEPLAPAYAPVPPTMGKATGASLTFIRTLMLSVLLNASVMTPLGTIEEPTFIWNVSSMFSVPVTLPREVEPLTVPVVNMRAQLLQPLKPYTFKFKGMVWPPTVRVPEMLDVWSPSMKSKVPVAP